MIIGDRSAESLLSSSGFAVRSQGPLEQGDIVLFSLSCQDGVVADTLDSLDRYKGSELKYGAILLADVNADTDPEIVELDELEFRFVLGTMIGEENADRLPVLLTGDAKLVSKINDLVNSEPFAVRMRSPNREEWNAYVDSF
ncbi:MAG: hypothetical protein OER86_00900 [Phycisphaerae bacterium]|nr:hypothetical protein [Phycisphaerae bacterium]